MNDYAWVFQVVSFSQVLWGNLRERDHLAESGIDGRIIVRWIFRKWGYGLNRSGSG